MRNPEGMSSGKLAVFTLFYLERPNVVKKLVKLHRDDCRTEYTSQEMAKL